MIVAYLLTGVVRASAVLIGGRFWAEEGSIMWSHARSSSFVDSLFFNPGGGYLNLYANLMTYVGSLLPTELGPYFTTWTSFLLAFLPAAMIIGLPLRIPISTTWRTLTGFGLLFIPAVTEPDIFANSLQMQVHFGVLAAILILVDFSELKLATIVALQALFLIMALSGVHAAVIGTVIFLTSTVSQVCCRKCTAKLKKHELKRLLATFVFVFGLIVQTGIFFVNRSTLPEEVTHHRGQIPSPSTVLAYVTSNFSTIFSGRLLTERVLEHSGLWILSTASLLLLVALFAVNVGSSLKSLKQFDLDFATTFFCQVSRVLSESRVQLVIAYCASSAVTIVGFVSPLPNARYQTVPSVLLYLIVVLVISNHGGKIITLVFLTILSISSILGIAYDPWDFLKCRAPCTEWITQVREVDQGSRTRFEFWPLHSSPVFDAPASPPPNWCDDFNALLSWKCDE